MKNKIALAIVGLLVASTAALGQSMPSPVFYYNFVPTAAQWNNYFQQKQDTLGYTPLNKAGDVMLGKLVTQGANSAQSGFKLPPGVAPTTPLEGDVWATTSGLFYYLGGVTRQVPLATGTGTATNVLHGNGVYGPVNLSTDASGTLQAAQAPAYSGDVASTAGSLTTTIQALSVTSGKIANNAVGNTQLAQGAAYSLKCNPTIGVANIQDCTIGSLTNNASPASTDLFLTQRASDGALVKTPVSAVTPVATYFAPQGRLTLQTGKPVMSTNTAGAATLYYTPFKGDLVPIYNGTTFIPTAFAEVSQLTTDATKSPAAVVANSLYDVFCWIDAGTNRCTRGPPWTSNTARGTGAGTTELVRVSGLYVNANAITNGPAAQRGTYVGTVRSDGAAQLNWVFGGNGTSAVLTVWNAYNGVLVTTTVNDSTVSWSYTSATIRQANNSGVNQVTFVSGLAHDGIDATYEQNLNLLSATTASAKIGLALDSATTFDRFSNPNRTNQTSTFTATSSVMTTWSPQLGYHYVSANEAGDGTNATAFLGGTSQGLVFRFVM